MLEAKISYQLQQLEVLLKLNKTCLKKYLNGDPSRCSQEKEVNTKKQRVYTAILSDYFI